MLKIIRLEKPIELTEDVEANLVKEFKESEKAVWRKDYITKPLYDMSHGKCCFCETNLGAQARYMTVDHFYFKEGYPDKVVSWENLLPACSQCNSNKGTHDVEKDGMLVNPTKDDPKEYLYLKHFMIKSKDNDINSKGRLTVDLLDLNNRDRLVNPRIKIALEMDRKMADIHEKMVTFYSRNDGKQYNRTRIINGTRDLLKMSQPEEEYSVFMATILLENEDYCETKIMMEEKGLWSEELTSLHNSAQKIKYDITKK